MISKVYKHHAQIPKFSVQDFCSKCEQICRKLCICLHLLKKSFSENFIFLKKMVTIISPEAQITDTNQIFTMKKSEGQCIYVTFKVSLNGHGVNSNLRGSDLHLTQNRSSCAEVFCKKWILKNFAKSTGKHFLNKVAVPATLLKKRLWRWFLLIIFSIF